MLRLQFLLIQPPAFLIEGHEYYRLGKLVRRQSLPHLVHGNGGSFFFGVAVDAGADAGEGHAGQLVLGGEAQAVAVAVR